MALTVTGRKPPAEWLFIGDARSLMKTGDYRRAVIDAGTAAELAMTEILDQYLATTESDTRNALLSRSRTLEGRATLIKELNAGEIPTDFTPGLKNPRNRAAHGGEQPTRSVAQKAVEIAEEIVEQAHPILGLLP
jgi:HEPN domain-containing protein